MIIISFYHDLGGWRHFWMDRLPMGQLKVGRQKCSFGAATVAVALKKIFNAPKKILRFQGIQWAFFSGLGSSCWGLVCWGVVWSERVDRFFELAKTEELKGLYENEDKIGLVVSDMVFIFQYIWDNPSHWLSICLKMVKTTNQKFNRTKRARGASPRWPRWKMSCIVAAGTTNEIGWVEFISYRSNLERLNCWSTWSTVPQNYFALVVNKAVMRFWMAISLNCNRGSYTF